MNEVYIIAEIGINHNGDLSIAKKLIDIAKVTGCHYVKFQKRTPELCVPDHQKSKPKDTPWGQMTYLEYKHKIEFGKAEYDEIDRYCTEKDIKWFASVWDLPSVDFMSQYTDMAKIPSALITQSDLCNATRSANNTLFISTGMSTEDEIDSCIQSCDPDIIFHTNSTYPAPVDQLNLNYISWLQSKYPNKIIGYSGHEYGLVPTFVAVVLGAQYIERHVTLDRTMWGSDQMASVEAGGLIKMTKAIRDIQKSLGSSGPREVLGTELSKKESLRG